MSLHVHDSGYALSGKKIFSFIPNLLTSLLQRINKSNRFASFHFETRSDYDNMQTPVKRYADLDQQHGRK